MVDGRKLLDIRVALNTMAADGTFTVADARLVTDSDEGTTTPAMKVWNAPSVRTAAQALINAVMEQSAQQGKPLTF